MTVLRTELDALLERVREDRLDPTGKNRNVIAYDCWRMFEDLAACYKEEFAARDRYKRQSNSWRDKSLELDAVNWQVSACDSGSRMKRAMTAAEFRAQFGVAPRGNKYHRAAKIDRTFCGVVYDSKAEAKYAAELSLMIVTGKIRNWFRQVPYRLEVNGNLICKLIIDFKVIHNDESEELIEVKGYATPEYKIKEKLFRALYPNTKLTVVKVR